ncbi:MAG: protein kinase, partial [Leptolyngbyaceae cyanobacterium CSU_1_3]|nr:protein kinase [Leptolyngbyaceae cyanobacterium CSU_1_3]
MQLRTGATLQGGKYILNQALGSEEFGVTYLATQTYLNQVVAIKTFDPSLQVTRNFPQLHQRFIEEIRLLARSQHPSIVRILDFFQEEGLPFVVMEYVPGKTLAEVIKSRGALPEAEAIHYIQQLGSALEIAHRNGLVHRNLKPQTIVRRQGTALAVLVGFGIAHDLAPSVSPPQTRIFDLNEFAPPDDSWTADHRFAIDLYALSTILYYLLTARLPLLPLQLDASWNPAIKQAILRGIAKDPKVRPQTIADWLRLLPRQSLPLAASPTAPSPTIASPSPQSTPQTNNGKSAAPALPKPPKIQPAFAENGKSLPAIPKTSPPSASTPKTVTPPALLKGLTQVPVRPILDRPLLRVLGITSAAAASIGIGFGIALRFSAAQSPGASIFHPEQAFPAKDWKGTFKPPDNLADIPLEKPDTAPNATNNLAAPEPVEAPEPSAPEYRNAPPLKSTSNRLPRTRHSSTIVSSARSTCGGSSACDRSPCSRPSGSPSGSPS